MTLNVNTNNAAMQALLALNNTTTDLATTQARISSGLNIASAKDGVPAYTVSQSQLASVSALKAVSDGLNRAQSIADVASSAGQSVSDLLDTLKTAALNAIDPSNSASDRATYNATFQSNLKVLQQTISSANFGGINLLNGSQSQGVHFLATADASSSLTLSGTNLTLGGSVITFSLGSSISTITNATHTLSLVAASLSNVTGALAGIGTQANQIQAHASFVSTLSNALTTGAHNMVAADTAAESARLTSLQVQQQLSVQALSIANQTPQIILSLFKG